MASLLSGIGIGGNPFSTPVGQLIERGTDASNASEDWSAFIEICDMINSTEPGAKDAVKAIRKRLHSSTKNYTVVMYTLTLLETCVKNCGKRFHLCIATKDFLGEMVKVLAPKNDPPTAVQEKILGLIQAWAEAFKGQADLKEVEIVYQDLKTKGIEFPMINLDQAPPIHTPARSAAPPPVSPTHQTLGHHPVQPPTHHPQYTQHASHRPPQQQQPQPVAAQPRSQGSGLGPEYFVKLRGQLDVVENNLRVFNEMMNELQAPSAPREDWLLMQELSATCKQMQERIVKLLQQIQHEEVTGELLRINDELNNVFVRWERFARGRPQEAATSSPAAPSVSPTGPVPTGPAPTGPAPTGPGPTGMAPAIPSRAAPPMAPAPAIAPVQAPRMAQASSEPPNLIDLDDPPAAGVANLSLNQPDEFSALAQSRTEPAHKPPPNPYDAQRQSDFAPSLGAAMTARSTGQPINDTERNMDEMEQWLRDNPEAPKESANPSTMTSSEFDRFLSERAVAGESLPAATSGTASSGTETRRQLGDDDGKNSMFAL